MKKLLTMFVIACVLLGLAPNMTSAAAAQEPILQVKLVNYLKNKTSISMKVSGTYYIKEKSYRLSTSKTYTLKVASGLVSVYDGSTKLASATTLTISSSNRNDHALLNNRDYLGNFKLSVENSIYVSVVNLIYLEDYIKCVVPAEMYASWNKEALKSQAVAARSFAYYSKDKVINDSPANYQAYEGTSKLYPNSTAATQETAGEILTYNGAVIQALFSASNGGMTQNNYNEYGSPALPYFPIKKDTYDTKLTWNPVIHKKQMYITSVDLRHPELWWDKINETDPTISKNIKAWLNNNGYSNKQIKMVSIPKVAFYEKDSSGRAIRGDLTITFFVKDKRDSTGKLVLQTVKKTNVIADQVRDIIGRSIIPSTLISSVTETTSAFSIKGSGNGHGIGLSQHGANNRANAGILYKSILTFYYPGTALTKAYSQTVSPDLEPTTYQSINIQLNGVTFKNGYSKDGATHIHWSALDQLKIPYTNKGNGLFVINGIQVQAANINNDWYIKWSQLAPGKITYEKINGGYNFIYYKPITIQLNGTSFKEGYSKDGATHIHWTAVNVWKMPYTDKGNGLFVINGREVQAVKINNDWYFRWSQIAPNHITYTKITGGYNFIYQP
ncbi:SpoIID/LytB domain-containing protein [Neobacillus sp. LXY-1]|uniref:SpoIID/LytB domain-containing protein n=1 Tax=Neobacillus sp. LXY-1 TaxID=3379133 RepID=UPI003EE016CC